jgi:hypothetical protein
VAISPLALRQLSLLRDINWAQLSNIGQTYGAASALLTGLALIGVAGSMVYQIRAIQVSSEQSIREQHRHLVEMALEDPVYYRCWGDAPEQFPALEGYRQHGYANLIMSFRENWYVLGGLNDSFVHGLAESFFHGEVGREYWNRVGNSRLQSSLGRRNKRFHRIIEQEYRKAIIAGPPSIRAQTRP